MSNVKRRTPEGTTTLSGAVYEGVRRDIFARKITPGARLKLQEIADEYEVSLAVVREALQRLQSEGLASARPQAGFSVVSLSVDKLLELTAARVGVEQLALTAAIEHGDLEWESRAIAAHHLLKATPMSAEGTPALSDDWSRLHREFHSALASGCENRYLMSIRQSLFDEAELYRRWSASGGSQRDIVAEHQALLDAVIGRDAATAVEQIAEHYWATTNALIELSSTWPSGNGSNEQD